MNRNRLLGLAALAGLALLVELAVLAPANAQQGASAPTEHAMVLPSVDEHVKVLSEKLGLSADQQEKARPIIAEMQDAMQKVLDDKSLTHEQMHERMQPIHMKADKNLREILTDEQKKKLDGLEHAHPEMRGK